MNEEQSLMINDFLSKDLIIWASRPMTVQRDELINPISQVLGTPSISVPNQKIRSFLVEKKPFNSSSKKMCEELLDDSFWFKHIDSYHEIVDKMMSLVKVLAKQDLTKKEETIANFLAFNDQLVAFSYYLMVPISIDLNFAQIFLEEMSSLSLESEKIFLEISKPSQPFSEDKLQMDILKQRINNKKDILSLKKKYDFMSEYSFIEELLDEKYFSKKFEEINPVNPELALKKYEEQFILNKKSYESILKILPSKKLRNMARIIHTYAYLRNVRMDAYKLTQRITRLFFQNINLLIQDTVDADWKYEYIPSMLNKEIITFFREGTLPSKEELEKRLDNKYVYFIFNGEAFVSTDEELLKKAKKNIVFKNDSEEIKGQIAFKGRIKGKVKLVHTTNDVQAVCQGDIMIAKMTFPSYFSAMKKASAIVTEDGGIISHAAIIARELKKPCIVGTKNCMSRFKDGDLVEVDANIGVVRKIS